MTEFFRFPNTPHIAWLGEGVPRGDKLLSGREVSELLAGEVLVEEKIDGANLGISVGTDGRIRAQNRGNYLAAPYAAQFSRLNTWVAAREREFIAELGENLMLFGEWCAARHSLRYDALPDWFLLFDVYDRTVARFWSTRRRNEFANILRMHVVPEISRGRFSLRTLEELLSGSTSRFRDGPMEGLVVRRESNEWCETRAKLVRAEFLGINEHWRSRRLEWNRVQPSAERRL